MIKLVAFDWNGTLFADTIACWEADNVMIQKHGLKPISLATFLDKFNVPVYKFYKSIGIDEQEVLKNSKINETIFHEYYERRAGKIRTRQHAKTLLHFLKDKSIESIIFSNHTLEGITKQLVRLKIAEFFASILANTQLDAAFKGRTKKEKLRAYIKSQNVKPHEVLIVGDTVEEIEIAKEIGTRSVAITGGYNSTSRLKETKPDFLIHDLKDIIAIISKHNS